MPRHTHRQYLEKAGSNAQFARALQVSNIRSPEWVVVSAFYAGVHYINAFLAQTAYQIEPDNHKARSGYVATVDQLRPIHTAYRRLCDKAWEARYTMASFTNEDAQALVDQDLSALEEHVRSLI